MRWGEGWYMVVMGDEGEEWYLVVMGDGGEVVSGSDGGWGW